MNFNLTLVGQMITFGLLVWFTMRFVWPPVITALRERQTRIADGLAAAEQGVREREQAEAKAGETLSEARQKAQEIIRQAERRATEIIEESKSKARDEGAKQLALAQAEIEQEVNRAREQLRSQVSGIAVAGAARILQREIDENAHSQMLNDLVEQI